MFSATMRVISFFLASFSSAVAVAANDRVLSEEQVEFFQREGYVVVSGLLGKSMVSDLTKAAQHTIQTSPRQAFYYDVSQTGLMFGSSVAPKPEDCTEPPSCNQNNRTTTKAFREAAVYSKLPQAVAELMKLNSETHNLRVLRDVFLAKSLEDPQSCDWHVDDLGFWPESYLTEEGMDGVNVWIALDDMPAAYQGSMAVAPRSHTAEWRERAYKAIEQNRTVDGGKTKEEVIQKIQKQRQASSSGDKPKSKYATCDMSLADPELREQIDATKHVVDYKRGDVIFATRLLFHRTLPVTEAGLKYYKEQGVEHLSRYSIRYVPGTARLPNGWSVEYSILEDSTNAGMSLDAVADKSDKLYYPQVWPQFEPELPKELEKMAEALPSLAQQATAEFMATIFGNNQGQPSS